MESEGKSAHPSDDPVARPSDDLMDSHSQDTLEKPRLQPQERRSHPRYTVDEDSTLLLVSHGLSLQCQILNLSLEGCRLRTRERYPAGTRTHVEVTFKVNGIAFRLLGVVEWTDGKTLLGVRFIEMASRRGAQLAEVICELDAAAAACEVKEAAALREALEQESKLGIAVAQEKVREQKQQHAEEPVGREAREHSEREASEWAEIQKIARRTKAAQEAAVLEVQNQASARRDRRAQVRHEVNTRAIIFLVHSGSTLSGRIVDLSENGCHIRSDERFKVGIYTRVETEFRLEGLPFRLAGVIQAVYDLNNVGIRFLDVSQRKRGQVKQLIAEIEAIEEVRTRPAAPGRGETLSRD